MSAVGAGALAVSADQAEAGVVYSGPMNVQIGFGPLLATRQSFTLPGRSTRFTFAGAASTYRYSQTTWRRVMRAYGSGMLFRNLGGVLQVFGPGATWGAAAAGGGSLVGRRTWTRQVVYSAGASTPTFHTYYFHHAGGNTAFHHQYALFRTTGLNYGWVKLSFDITDAYGSNPAFGPTVTVEGYAYDDTGAKLAAGDIGAAAPEPATLVETGLAALVLGAAGWRRRKRAD